MSEYYVLLVVHRSIFSSILHYMLWKPTTANSRLHFLFGKNFEKATRIVDQRGVKRISGEQSSRTVFQVLSIFLMVVVLISIYLALLHVNFVKCNEHLIVGSMGMSYTEWQISVLDVKRKNLTSNFHLLHQLC